jgi:putative transposase
VPINSKKVIRFKHQLKLKTVARVPFANSKYATTKYIKEPKHTAPNLIKDGFNSERPNLKFCTDITQVNGTDGKVYFSVALDLFDKSISGETISFKQQDTYACVELLNKLENLPGAIVHSDRGGTYRSGIYAATAAKNNITLSMTEGYKSYQNQPIENLFAIFKRE